MHFLHKQKKAYSLLQRFAVIDFLQQNLNVSSSRKANFVNLAVKVKMSSSVTKVCARKILMTALLNFSGLKFICAKCWEVLEDHLTSNFQIKCLK